MLKNGEDTLEKSQLEEAQPGPLHPADGEPVSLARAFGGRSLLREIVETVLLTLVVFLLINTTTARFQVRGSSMEPTLHDEQYLVISKLIYWIHPPERGDIIVFHPPNNPTEDYIKRVVGLPGEKITVQSGEIWVNDVPLEEFYITNPGHYSDSWNLKEGEYFVLGDNRSNSSDSHTWGMLPRDNIIGKAWLCYWPPEEWGLTTHYVFQEPVYQRRE